MEKYASDSYIDYSSIIKQAHIASSNSVHGAYRSTYKTKQEFIADFFGDANEEQFEHIRQMAQSQYPELFV